MSKKAILRIVLTLLLVITYLLIIIFDDWHLRLLFGLVLVIAFPLVPLYFALNSKIRLTKYDPNEMPKERFILRNLGRIVRVCMILFAIFSAVYLTLPYVKGVARLAFKEHDLCIVKGVIKNC